MQVRLWILISTLSLVGPLACGQSKSNGSGDPCDVSNPPPSCLANQHNEKNSPRCDPANGGTELCDGNDNDCDAKVDEDFELDVPCEAGEGACRNTGVAVCNEDKNGVVCSAISGDPSNDEFCDGNDNDCDGQVDEDFLGDEDEPGLGDPCTVGKGACTAEGIWVCNDDEDGLECDATPGSSTEEMCDGIDNDCDGEIDEDFTTLGAPCTNGVGACEEAGVYICDADKDGLECDATPGTPTEEMCDDTDNDCDGLIDEDASDAFTYYLDCDADGFAANATGSRDRCSAPDDSVAATACGTGIASWTATAPTGSNVDCHGNNADVFPGQMKWFSTPYLVENQSGTSFDYNCEGTAERRYTDRDISTSAPCANSGTETSFNPCGPSGWTARTVQNCGDSAQYTFCDTDPTTVGTIVVEECNGSRIVENRTQECL